MKGITCNNAIEAEGFRSALMEAGIESTLYDETNSKVARGILDKTVDVLVKEEDYDQAQKLYQTFLNEQQNFKPWCPKCGGENVVIQDKKCATARQLPRILAALLMFLFYQSMFFAGINNTGAVRKSTVYAMVYIMLGLTVAIDLFIKMSMPSNAVSGIDSEVVMPTLSNILTYAGDISLCVYALFFSLSNIKVADKTAVIPEPDEEETEKTDKNVTLDEKTDESTEDKKENKEKEDVKPVEATPIEGKKSDE